MTLLNPWGGIVVATCGSLSPPVPLNVIGHSMYPRALPRLVPVWPYCMPYWSNVSGQ